MPRTDNRLAERHVIVTGGANGIGRGVAVRTAQAGAMVTVFDIDVDGATETRDRIVDKGSTSRVCRVDVTDPDSIAAGVSDAVEAFGPVHGLVNNAGVQDIIPILETAGDEWDRHLEVNAKGTFLCSKIVATNMIETGVPGSIVNIASMSAIDPGPGQGAYGASKGAVAAFTVVLAKELGEHRINANSINPGSVDTPMFRRWLEQLAADLEEESNELYERMIAGQSLGRIGQPEDIGNLATYLLSEEAEWISGEAFNISGTPD